MIGRILLRRRACMASVKQLIATTIVFFFSTCLMVLLINTTHDSTQYTAANNEINTLLDSELERALAMPESTTIAPVLTFTVTGENGAISKSTALSTRRPIVNEHNFKWTILETDLCGGRQKDVFILAVVHSAPANVQRRMHIRATWGSRNYFNLVIEITYLKSTLYLSPITFYAFIGQNSFQHPAPSVEFTEYPFKILPHNWIVGKL